jgi:hypothetical protein
MKRQLSSGWCETGNHGRCGFVLQDDNGHRPHIECSCSCHAVTRATAAAGVGAQTG